MLKTREEYIEKYLPMNIIGAELGIFEGTFSNILYNSNKFKKLYLVDIFEGLMYSGDKNGENGKTINLNDAYHHIIHKYEKTPTVEIVKNTSLQFLNNINDNFLAFVYIDADHSYNAVKNDLQLSRLKVCPSGIIAGHDYNSKMFPDVVRAVEEFVKEYNLSLELTTDDKLASYFITNHK